MLTVVALLFSLLIVACGGFRYVADAVKGGEACHECGYSLAGTPSVLQCPECGTREPMDHPRYVWSWRSAAPFFLAGLLWVGSTLIAERLAGPMRAWSYEVRIQLDSTHLEPPLFTGLSVFLICATLPVVAFLRLKRYTVLTMVTICFVALGQYIGVWPLRCLLSAPHPARAATPKDASSAAPPCTTLEPLRTARGSSSQGRLVIGGRDVRFPPRVRG